MASEIVMRSEGRNTAHNACSDCEVFRKECANCPLLHPRAQCFVVGCPVAAWCERVGCPVLKENLELDRYWGWDISEDIPKGEKDERSAGEIRQNA